MSEWLLDPNVRNQTPYRQPITSIYFRNLLPLDPDKKGIEIPSFHLFKASDSHGDTEVIIHNVPSTFSALSRCLDMMIDDSRDSRRAVTPRHERRLDGLALMVRFDTDNSFLEL